MNNQGEIRTYLNNNYRKIRSIVGKVTSYEMLADDISQECCARIIEKERLWDRQKGTVEAWVNAVVRNFTINFSKKFKGNSLRYKNVNDYETAGGSEPTFSEDQVEWVVKRYTQIPKDEKVILHMKYYEGMKDVEIAGKLGLSPRAVGKRLEKAIWSLRRGARNDGILAALLPWNWSDSKWHTVLKNTTQHIFGGVMKLYQVMTTGIILTAFIFFSAGIIGYKTLINSETDSDNYNKVKENFKISLKAMVIHPIHKPVEPDPKLIALVAKIKKVNEKTDPTEFTKLIHELVTFDEKAMPEISSLFESMNIWLTMACPKTTRYITQSEQGF